MFDEKTLESLKNFGEAAICLATTGDIQQCSGVTPEGLIAIALGLVGSWYGVIAPLVKYVLKPGADMLLKDKWEKILKRFHKEELEKLIQEALTVIMNAKVNRDKLATMMADERQIQVAYWEEVLRRQKTEAEIRAVMLDYSKNFVPAPKLAWRIIY